MVLIVLCFGVEFCAVCTLCTFSYFSYVRVTEWPPFGKWLLCSANDMFSYKYLIVNLFFPISVF